MKFKIMEAITRVWFKDGRIYIFTDHDNTYSRPLEAFPLLLDSTEQQRAKYEIGLYGDDIHWDEIDEDIHISSFFEVAEPDLNNPVAEIFHKFPQLNISEVADAIGINKSLLSKYIYGIKKPSRQRMDQITSAIRQIGLQMASV